MRPSELDPRLWRQIDQLLGGALEREGRDRSTFLRDACDGDPELRAYVEELLEAHELAGDRFGEPVSELATTLLRSPFGPGPVNGRALGPFRIVRETGHGGMGVVYLAEDTRLDRKVAIKLLPPYLDVGPEARARFVDEAKIISALDHPNVATLYEADVTEDGRPYMVFAFYDGETLERIIRRGPLDPARAVAIARQIADGLAAAHDRGIIHRDVKPSNVLLTERGVVKLLDFGVAKVGRVERPCRTGPVGTVAYMSPEQARGEALDPRTDVWSLGVVLHEMLTQRLPSRLPDGADTARGVLGDANALAQLPGALSRALGRVLGRLLSEDPTERYGSAREASKDLAAIGVELELFGSGRSRGWGRTVVGAAALLLLAWVATVPSSRGSASPFPARIDRLAVLPLENRSADATRQYVVDGIHEGIITQLSQSGVADVLSRTSVASVAKSSSTLSSLAEQLQVDAVVEGSVTSRADSLTVSVGLVGLFPERLLWSNDFAGDMDQAIDISGQVARAIRAALEVPVDPEVEARLARRSRVDPAAYDAYLQGRFNMSRGNVEGFALAERHLRRAIGLDSTFAPAWVELAELRGRAAFFGLRDPAETVPGVSELVDRALALDSSLPLAHITRAHVLLYWDRDWKEAGRAARRALELNPSLVEGYFTLSEIEAVAGNHDEALRLAARGTDLAPWDQFAAVRPALALYYKGDFDRAIDRVGDAIDFFPEFWQGHWLSCVSSVGADLFAQALAACEEAVERSGRAPMAVSALAYTHAASGNSDTARALLDELLQPPRGGYVAPADVAAVYTGLGETDEAFSWLDRAYRDHDMRLVQIASNNLFDGLHGDPRFSQLLDRMGVPGP